MKKFEDFKSWFIKEDIEFKKYIPIDIDNHYLLDASISVPFIHELFYNISYTHNNENVIEFWQSNNKKDIFELSYLKDENNTCIYPIHTFIIFLSEYTSSIINFDLDINSFKCFLKLEIFDNHLFT